MKTRILSGLIMLPLLLVVFFGGKVLLLACFFIGIMGVREFYNGFSEMQIKPSYIIAYVSAFGLYTINLFAQQIQWYMVWFFGVVLLSLLYLF